MAPLHYPPLARVSWPCHAFSSKTKIAVSFIYFLHFPLLLTYMGKGWKDRTPRVARQLPHRGRMQICNIGSKVADHVLLTRTWSAGHDHFDVSMPLTVIILFLDVFELICTPTDLKAAAAGQSSLSTGHQCHHGPCQVLSRLSVTLTMGDTTDSRVGSSQSDNHLLSTFCAA
jgi:hypothetical protein